MTTSRAIRAKRWVLERYDIIGERMLPSDMTPPFPSPQRLSELAAILAQQYFVAKVPMKLKLMEVV